MFIWSGTLSPFSAKVRIACREKQLSPEIREIPWNRVDKWHPKPQAFLEVSPRGEVPVLQDGDLAVFDSTTILEYLDEAYPETPLRPAVPAERAVCRMFEDEADRMMATGVTVLIQEVFLKPDGNDRDELLVTDTLTGFDRYYRHLDQHLETQTSGDGWLCGNFSVADIATFMCLGFARTLGADFSDHAALTTWFDRAYARESCRSEFDAMMTAAASV